MPEAISAVCGTHPQAPAVATCRRCGIFLCDACVVLVGDESYCAGCAQRRTAPASTGSKVALALGLLVLLIGTGPLLSAIALALSLGERRKLLRGDVSPRTRPWMLGALISSSLGLVLALAWVALFVADVIHHGHYR